MSPQTSHESLKTSKKTAVSGGGWKSSSLNHIMLQVRRSTNAQGLREFEQLAVKGEKC